MDTLNGIDLCDSPFSFGSKSSTSDLGAQEMEMLKSTLAELESKIKELENIIDLVPNQVQKTF